MPQPTAALRPARPLAGATLGTACEGLFPRQGVQTHTERGQFGLVTRWQALGGGVTPKAIECHVGSGRWATVDPGVYLTTPGREDWSVRAMAALLAVGPGAALFKASAGYAWGLVRSEPSVLDVVIPAARAVKSTDEINVTRSRYCPARTDVAAWPHRVNAAHTVFDLAGSSSGVDNVMGLAARALHLRLVTGEQLTAALLERARQAYRGIVLEALTDVAHGSESPAEVRYLRDVERAHGLPTSRRQVPFAGSGRRDIEYEAYALVVEGDGRLGHDGWAGRQQDGRRDRGALVTGRVTLRCFWTDLVPTAFSLTLEVVAILTDRGWTGRPHPCGRRCPVGRLAQSARSTA